MEETQIIERLKQLLDEFEYQTDGATLSISRSDGLWLLYDGETTYDYEDLIEGVLEFLSEYIWREIDSEFNQME